MYMYLQLCTDPYLTKEDHYKYEADHIFVNRNFKYIFNVTVEVADLLRRVIFKCLYLVLYLHLCTNILSC